MAYYNTQNMMLVYTHLILAKLIEIWVSCQFG